MANEKNRLGINLPFVNGVAEGPWGIAALVVIVIAILLFAR
jgi:hypothetical protein